MPDRPPVHRPPGWRPRQPWERTQAQRETPLPKGWAKLRASVLALEPLCRPCGEAGRVSAAAEVDHIVPRSAGGSSGRSNLQPICTACHRRKSAHEGAAASARGTGDTG